MGRWPAPLIAALVCACGDLAAPHTTTTTPATPTAAARPNLGGSTCGVSFRAVTEDDDAVMASHGVPPIVDTVHVCETWTGNDYIVRETHVGSAPNSFIDAPDARTLDYRNGAITGFAAAGGQVGDALPVNGTLFDFMFADAPTRQAAYDDPYWAVYAAGGTEPCPGNAILCSRSEDVDRLGTATASDTLRRFDRHGVKRRGVRALLDDAEETGGGAPGARRFRKRRGDVEVILTLDRATELLVEEETRERGRTRSRTRHSWKADGRGGYVRERTETETTEVVDGRPAVSRSTSTLLDLTLADGRVVFQANGNALDRRTP